MPASGLTALPEGDCSVLMGSAAAAKMVSPFHLLPPAHEALSATPQEATRCSTGKTKTTRHGRFDEFYEISTHQHPEQTSGEKRNEAIYKANRMVVAKDKRDAQQAFGDFDSQNCHSIPPKMLALSVSIPRVDRPRRSSLRPVHQPPKNRNCCLLDRPCLSPIRSLKNAPSPPLLQIAVPHHHLHHQCHDYCSDDERKHLYQPPTYRNVTDTLSTTNTLTITNSPQAV
ncbi:hypothetical protein SprV_0100327800 [Sparganum proliferum]